MMVPGDGRVLAYTAAYLDVTEDLTILAVRPHSPVNIETVTVRIAYLYRALDQMRLPSSIGLACFDSWPPEGYGPSFDAPGAQLKAGDSVTVLSYIRPTAVGDFGTTGVTVDYRQGNKTRSQTFEFVHVAGQGVEKGVEIPPARSCDSIVPSWRTPPSAANACLTRPDTPCAKPG